MKWTKTSSAKSQYFFLHLIGLCGLLVGCSSQPSPSDGERGIQNLIQSDSESRIKLVQFRKTNGQLAEVMGVKVYALEFETEIEFLEDCRWMANAGEAAGFHTSKLPAQPPNETAQFMQDALSFSHGTTVTKGQRAQLVGVIRFEKKENGWSIDKVEIIRAKVMATGSANPPQEVADGKSLTESPAASVAQANKNSEKADAGVVEAAKEAFLEEMSKSSPVPIKLIKFKETDRTSANSTIDSDSLSFEARLGFAKNTTLANLPMETGDIMVLVGTVECKKHGERSSCLVTSVHVVAASNPSTQADTNAVEAAMETFQKLMFSSIPKKVVEHKATGWLPAKSSSDPNFLSFEVTFEVEKDTVLEGVSFKSSDRITLLGIMECKKNNGSWDCFPQWESLHVAAASNPPLFAFFKKSEEASDAARIASARRNSCINNLRQIDAAKQQWALENNKAETATPTPNDLTAYIGRGGGTPKLPTCPEGGNYNINSIGNPPTCSIAGHSLQ